MNKLFKMLSFVFLVFVVFSTCTSTKAVIVSDDLKIIRLTKHAYLHVSNLNIPNYGKFPCNGIVYISNKEALVFDTPSYNHLSEQLINWIEKELKATIKGVVPNHHHIDCLGGLTPFHQRGISSYGTALTRELAALDSMSVPTNDFEKSITLKVGNKKTIVSFFGEAHTKDNIVAWFPDDKLLFGGCMIKSVGAGKGNLADANVEEWANTVRKVKMAYPDAAIVVPGHKQHGGQELLDFTIQLFSK